MSVSRLIDILMGKKDISDGKIKSSRFIYLGDSIFEGEIKNKQEEYAKDRDSVTFKSRFYGNTECSYFAAEIIPPQDSFFPPNTIHLDDASGNVTSFCDATIIGNIQNAWNIHNIPNDLGTIHGRNIKTEWFEWSWEIPEFAPKGEYRVIIGLWSDSQDDDSDKSIPIQFSEDSFFVTDLVASRYQKQI